MACRLSGLVTAKTVKIHSPVRPDHLGSARITPPPPAPVMLPVIIVAQRVRVPKW